MRIVFLGPPGSGKGTQSIILCKEFDMVPLSTGEILREAVKQKTPLGHIVAPIIKQGLLVSDDIMNRIVEERLSQPDCIKKGYILDGYPRTLAQAKALTHVLRQKSLALTHVFLFEIDDRLTRERIIMRARTAQKAREGQLRDDDSDAISQKRLDLYYSQVAALIDYYAQVGILYKIDAQRSIEEVTTSLRHCLEKGENLHNSKREEKVIGGKIDQN